MIYDPSPEEKHPETFTRNENRMHQIPEEEFQETEQSRFLYGDEKQTERTAGKV